MDEVATGPRHKISFLVQSFAVVTLTSRSAAKKRGPAFAYSYEPGTSLSDTFGVTAPSRSRVLAHPIDSIRPPLGRREVAKACRAETTRTAFTSQNCNSNPRRDADISVGSVSKATLDSARWIELLPLHPLGGTCFRGFLTDDNLRRRRVHDLMWQEKVWMCLRGVDAEHRVPTD